MSRKLLMDADGLAAGGGDAVTAGGGDAVATGWADEVRRLAAQRDAVILAHNYQSPEIQDVADHVGDSLALARLAAASSARTIVLAGVWFMAETAKILSPERTVLIPDRKAGCSLADSITAAQLRAWKAEYPGAVVVAYVNTSAEVKAESDVCCTSSNAVEIVSAIPAGRDVLFLPDQFLGAHVRRQTGRDNVHVWMGECHVHAGISPAELRRKAQSVRPGQLFIHPECGCATPALWQAGTGGMTTAYKMKTRRLVVTNVLQIGNKTEVRSRYAASVQLPRLPHAWSATGAGAGVRVRTGGVQRRAARPAAGLCGGVGVRQRCRAISPADGVQGDAGAGVAG
jgi:quinolinate synthase